MAIFDPFYFVRETKASPHARTLRTTLWQKLKDTFWILNGNFFNFSRKGKNKEVNFGVLDYLTLGIPRLLSLITAFCFIINDNPSKRIKALAMLVLLTLGLPGLVLAGLVALASLALTTALSPLVIIIHLFSKIKGDEYKAEAAKALFDKEKATVDDYETLNPKDISYDFVHLNLIKFLNVPIQSPSAKKALMKLNFGKITSTLEENGFTVNADKGTFTKNSSS